MPDPRRALDIREAQVIKDDRAFFLSDGYGDVPEGNAAALGLYSRDTRFLSRLELLVDGLRPLLLHSSTERNYSQRVELVHPVRMVSYSGHERKDSVSLRRSRVLSGALFERIQVRNYGLRERRVRLSLRYGADFLDVFEVRGFERARRGQAQPPSVDRNRVVLSYRGLDGEPLSTILRFSPVPTELSADEAVFEIDLAPDEGAQIAVEIIPRVGAEPERRRPMRAAADALQRGYNAWRKSCTSFSTSNTLLSNFLERAVLDLRMLSSTDSNGSRSIDGGIPWYAAPFGRDSLIAAYESLGVARALAWGTLRGLAARQGKRVDDWTEEEPGKIMHELRSGELARVGEIPHTPYYGSADATPLWLVVLAAAHRWTDDLDAVRELWPNALAALAWIDEHGDADGDGYVEYRKRSPMGLDNQGWKDSADAIVFPDGTPVDPPIALVEVQGYVYQAKRNLAPIARQLGDEELAKRLDREAEELRERFNRDFWLEREGYFALALDAEKRPVATISSNPGHCLWSGIVDGDKAPRVAYRLVSPTLSSGWGIRTLAARQPAFDPVGYHTGTVWPHDNALIAHGLKRYGFDAEARAVLDQLTTAGAHFPYSRFPELYCGFSADEVPVPVEYPVACRPQAWASGAPLLMVRSYGGLNADAANRRLFIVRPQLPRWLERVEIRGMLVGEARLDLTFTNHEGVTATQVPRKEGDVDVLIRQ